MEKVSVIIANYNYDIWLMEAIKSVEDQTYQNIEIIVIDDASENPKTKSILKALRKEKNIKVHIFDKNQGIAKVRNFGGKIATGKYLLFLDADDFLAPNYIEKAMAIFQKDKNIGIVYCNVILYDEKKQTIWQLPPFDLKELLIRNHIHNSAIIKKELFLSTEGYDNSLSGLEDWDFWISVFEKNKNIIAYKIPEPLFYYRQKANSRQKKLQENDALYQQTINYIKNKHNNFYIEVLGHPRELYIQIKKLEKKIYRLENSKSYKIGRFITKPFRFIKTIENK